MVVEMVGSLEGRIISGSHREVTRDPAYPAEKKFFAGEDGYTVVSDSDVDIVPSRKSAPNMLDSDRDKESAASSGYPDEMAQSFEGLGITGRETSWRLPREEQGSIIRGGQPEAFRSSQ